VYPVGIPWGLSHTHRRLSRAVCIGT